MHFRPSKRWRAATDEILDRFIVEDFGTFLCAWCRYRGLSSTSR